MNLLRKFPDAAFDFMCCRPECIHSLAGRIIDMPCDPRSARERRTSDIAAHRYGDIDGRQRTEQFRMLRARHIGAVQLFNHGNGIGIDFWFDVRACGIRFE